ncbi:MAG TPA: hypothetical protein VFU22_26535 [Roseiflexaceae bacterium]|nr:hypothetical protein [Roseiflexaceae bacterium]
MRRTEDERRRTNTICNLQFTICNPNIVIVGLVGRGVGVMFPGLDLTCKEMTIVGSRASVGCFPEALELLASGAISYPQIATGFDLWNAPEIFARRAENPAMVHKGVLMMEANL